MGPDVNTHTFNSRTGRPHRRAVADPVTARRLCPFALVVALLATLSGCTASRSTVSPPPTPTTTVTTESVPSTTAAPSTDITTPPDACPEGDVMVADGRLLQFDRPNADATRIAGVTWRTSGDCLSVTVTFSTDDGAPATTPPPLTARVLRSAGVLRIDTEATSSVVVDQLLEEDLVERLFVPVDAEEFRFVDLVLNEPVVARAQALTSPARLEIELQAGGPEEIGSPLVSSELVVIEPVSSADAEPILDIAGYSTGQLETITMTVLRGETVLTELEVPLEPEPNLWKAFNVTLPVGDAPYDNLRITTDDESVVAGIPFTG